MHAQHHRRVRQSGAQDARRHQAGDHESARVRRSVANPETASGRSLDTALSVGRTLAVWAKGSQWSRHWLVATCHTGHDGECDNMILYRMSKSSSRSKHKRHLTDQSEQKGKEKAESIVQSYRREVSSRVIGYIPGHQSLRDMPILAHVLHLQHFCSPSCSGTAWATLPLFIVSTAAV